MLFEVAALGDEAEGPALVGVAHAGEALAGGADVREDGAERVDSIALQTNAAYIGGCAALRRTRCQDSGSKACRAETT